MKQKCGGQQDRNTLVIAGAMRASVEPQKKTQWVRNHNSGVTTNDHKHFFRVPLSLDDDLTCTRCDATHPEGWRRFSLLAKRTCHAAHPAVP